MNEDNPPTRGIIHMISGIATDGDSGRARKAYERRLENFEISKGADIPQDPIISFGQEDLRGVVTPHYDALMVMTTISNYDVTRIFIDNGSSTVLPLTLGNDHRRVTKMITFTMVDTPSAYNEILGWPALKDFRAAVSNYHQKLKFLVRKRVGVLCGYQKVARQCNERVMKEEGKRAHVEVNMIRKGRSGLPIVKKEVQEVADEEPEIIELGSEKKTLNIALDLDPGVKK
ncbi:uncharacterized protein [Primulina huaijiensis]|uniref:uncharacterized protein n=1 Tax=Primulina huaijiensis TaxID=1492673 RepID=UPI003CC6E464